VELTYAGRRLVPIARDLMERVADVGAFIQQLPQGEPEVFCVGYSPFLGDPRI
jgi:DNA-binding transcriptional LysR family regulator